MLIGAVACISFMCSFEPWCADLQGPAATAAAAAVNTGHSTRSRNLSQLSSQASHQLEVYQAQHAAVVADVAAVLQQLGLRPGVGCVVGDDVTTIDLGVIAGDPPRQVRVSANDRGWQLGRHGSTAPLQLPYSGCIHTLETAGQTPVV